MRTMGVLLVALAVGAAGCGSEDSAAGKEPDVPVPAKLAEACPAWDPIRYAGGDLPEGAVSVRLCPGPPIVAHDGTIYDTGIQPPEVLTTRVDELVDAVNSLEEMPEDIMCPADGGSRLTYWFSYPDGDARAVTFENFGCELLLVDEDTYRVDGNQVARLFTEALLTQRAASTPPGEVSPAPDCRGVMADPHTTLPHEPVDLASAVLCVYAGGYRVREVEVPEGLRVQFEEGLLGEDIEWEDCEELSRPHVTLFGYTRWGDRVRYMLDQCGRVGLPSPPGWLREEEPVYRLPAHLAEQIDALPPGPVVRYTKPFTKTTPPATPG